jgi:hypothetical protein
MEQIKKILFRECNMVSKINLNINDYKDVVNVWRKFNSSNILDISTDRRKIKDLFIFHQHMIDHIILYHSVGKDESLLLCRVDGEYINILIPSYNLKAKEYSIVATFT